MLVHLVSQEGLDDTVNDVLDPSPLDVIPVARLLTLYHQSLHNCVGSSPMPVVILVDSFEPAHVIVSVSYPVDIDHPGDRGGTRVSAAYSEAAHCELENLIRVIR